MKCLRCGFENVEGAGHCINCGARMDGNITCPKCGAIISPDSDYCSKCGKKIPHKEAPKDKTKYRRVVDNISVIFNKVSTIVILVLLALSLFAVFGSYFETSVARDANNMYGYAHQFFIDLFRIDLSGLNNEQITSVLLSSVTPALVVLTNIAVTFVFAIRGIIRSRRSIQKKEYKPCYSSLAIVMVSNLISQVIIVSLYSNQVYLGGTVNGFTGTCIANLMVMIVFEIFKSFEKGKVAKFIEKIFFALTFLFAIILINNCVNPVFIANDISYRGLSLFNNLIYNLGSHSDNASYITALSLQMGSIDMVILEIAALTVLIIFFSKGFFSGKERSMKFKIPCYSFSFFTAITTLIILIIGIVVSALLFTDSNKAFIGSFPIVNFALGLFTFGFAFASLMISRSINHAERLAEQTTIK